ncbi:hypothetical protein Cni_G23088 [Canna indica]|uniref:Uncharacterized protein n=1 Tax=Canna indica TaxID=4628 RepID=A0AAQ3QLX0_9LILI|nr:hypothetical protein Cni_G23088 [Canna indica]
MVYSPPLGLMFRPPNSPAICLPLTAFALGPSRSSCAALQIPILARSSVCSSLDSAWIGIERSHRSRRTRRNRTMGLFFLCAGIMRCGHMSKDDDGSGWSNNHRDGVFTSGSSEESGVQIPTQTQSLVEGSGTVVVSEYKPIPDIDYLQELLAIQQQGPRSIGFFGTRNMGFMHQQLIEILSYAMVITKNHIFTSGASGTNAAVIRGALRAEKPELLTVILPQSLKMQPPESQELLSKVQNLIEKPENDHLPLIEASRLCNMDILSKVQQVICFAFHDSKLLMQTCQEAKNLRKIVTLFYLD